MLKIKQQIQPKSNSTQSIFDCAPMVKFTLQGPRVGHLDHTQGATKFIR